MARFLLIILLILVLYYLLRFLLKPMFTLDRRSGLKDPPEELVQDPYCQTYIPKGSGLKKRIGGKDYYFCKKDCYHQYVKQHKPSQ